MRPPRVERRGQSEAAGVVVLLGIMVLSLASLGVLGASSFDDTTSKVSVEVAQHEFASLAGEIQAVASGNAPVRTVSLSLDGADSSGTTTVNESAGSIAIAVGNETVYAGSLGTIEYEQPGVRIAYQGGGVFRAGPGKHAELVVAPPYTTENLSTATLALPITVVLGLDGLSNGAVIESVDTQRFYPTLRVPTNEAVTITIESPYYRSWRRYFIDRLGLPEQYVRTDPATDRVTVTYGSGTEVYLHLTVTRVRVSNR